MRVDPKNIREEFKKAHNNSDLARIFVLLKDAFIFSIYFKGQFEQFQDNKINEFLKISASGTPKSFDDYCREITGFITAQLPTYLKSFYQADKYSSQIKEQVRLDNEKLQQELQKNSNPLDQLYLLSLFAAKLQADKAEDLKAQKDNLSKNSLPTQLPNRHKRTSSQSSNQLDAFTGTTEQLKGFYLNFNEEIEALKELYQKFLAAIQKHKKNEELTVLASNFFNQYTNLQTELTKITQEPIDDEGNIQPSLSSQDPSLKAALVKKINRQYFESAFKIIEQKLEPKTEKKLDNPAPNYSVNFWQTNGQTYDPSDKNQHEEVTTVSVSSAHYPRPQQTIAALENIFFKNNAASAPSMSAEHTQILREFFENYAQKFNMVGIDLHQWFTRPENITEFVDKLTAWAQDTANIAQYTRAFKQEYNEGRNLNKSTFVRSLSAFQESAHAQRNHNGILDFSEPQIHVLINLFQHDLDNLAEELALKKENLLAFFKQPASHDKPHLHN